MPYMTNGKRDYKKEYSKYHSRSKQIKNRSQRNQARAMMVKAGKAHKGDGMDVGHKKAVIKGGLNTMLNLHMQTKKSNRSVAKTRKNRMKGNG